jgi:hypothetical protein
MYIASLQSRITRAEGKYAALVTDVEIKTAIREAENKLKLAQAHLEAEKTKLGHLALTTALLVDLKKEKAKNENFEVTIDYLNSERDILRNEIANIDLRLPEGGICPSDPAASGRNSYATLVRACQLTTIDYNALREAFDTNCKLTGCE